MRVLFVGDGSAWETSVAMLLKREKYLSDSVGYGEDFSEYLTEGIYDLLVLMSPSCETESALIRRLRLSGAELPILLLSSRHDAVAVAEALDAGADDYVRLPCDSDELMARMRALTRRKGSFLSEKAEVGETYLDFSRRGLVCGERVAALSEKEYEIARMLFSAPGRIVPKEKLGTKVWGLNSETGYNSVEVYITFLRRKLRAVGSGLVIGSVRGAGYRLTAEEIQLML